MNDRAHEKPCAILHSALPISCTIVQLDNLLEQLARHIAEYPSDAPGTTIVDCSSLIPEASGLALYSLWVTRVSTPSVFSLTCVGEHLRKQFIENGKLIMSIFNDAGRDSEGEEGGGPGTYMVVFKRIDALKQRCVPVNFSTREKEAIKGVVLRCHQPKGVDEKAKD